MEQVQIEKITAIFVLEKNTGSERKIFQSIHLNKLAAKVALLKGKRDDNKELISEELTIEQVTPRDKDDQLVLSESYVLYSDGIPGAASRTQVSNIQKCDAQVCAEERARLTKGWSQEQIDLFNHTSGTEKN